MRQGKHAPYAVLLRLRERTEAIEERALIALRREMDGHRKELSALALEAEQHAGRRLAQVQQVASAAQHRELAAHGASLRERQASLRKKQEMLEQRFGQQQIRFLEARKERQTVAELHEKNEKLRAIALAEAERKLIDGLVAARHQAAKQTD